MAEEGQTGVSAASPTAEELAAQQIAEAAAQFGCSSLSH